MNAVPRLSRRGFASLAVGLLLAGCSEGTPDGSTPTATTSPPMETGTATPTPTESVALDRREANVVGVEFEKQDGSVNFSVTLHHDDAGEEGYANWWQVETLEGTRLGRRDLAHPHANQPFTRDETIEIPAEVACVVVRGHDQTHGYGGRAVLVDLASGHTLAVNQGAEPDAFDSTDCP